MVIGCLSETFNVCPAAISAYFTDFMQVLGKYSKDKDGSMIRNVAYSFGVFAEKTPIEIFTPHKDEVLATIQIMYKNAVADEDAGAKDNCVASIVRILDRFQSSIAAD